MLDSGEHRNGNARLSNHFRSQRRLLESSTKQQVQYLEKEMLGGRKGRGKEGWKEEWEGGRMGAREGGRMGARKVGLMGAREG